MALPQLPDITHVIQLAVAPVFLLAGVGAIINVLSGRLARIVDRARAIEALIEAGEGDGAALVARLETLSERARFVSMAMTLAVTCALLVSVMIAVAFVDAFLPMNLAVVVAIMFVLAMFAFSAALLAFLHEIRLASANLRFGIRETERKLEN
jgi:hypothetical protein